MKKALNILVARRHLANTRTPLNDTREKEGNEN